MNKKYIHASVTEARVQGMDQRNQSERMGQLRASKESRKFQGNRNHMANRSKVSRENNYKPGTFYTGETVLKKRGLNISISIQTTSEEIYQEVGAIHRK